jgi:HEAT repeat protein
VMVHQLLRSLVKSQNAAADDVLIDALRVGRPSEQILVLGALLARNSLRGLIGVVELYAKLSPAIQAEVVANIKALHPAIREAGRSSNAAQRLAAIGLIADGRQGKLSYVLSENLHTGDEQFAKAAAAALTVLSRWIAHSIRQLQHDALPEQTETESESTHPLTVRSLLYSEVLNNRPDVEQAIIRALELHRGSVQQDLIQAAMLLCDHAEAPVMRVLSTSRHAGQTAMIRKIQQAPEPDHVTAFLLGATHNHLRAHFGVTFSKIENGAVLDAILCKTHWLADNQLQLCVKQVHQGAWLGETDLTAELNRQSPANAARIGRWIVASGLNDQEQDSRLDRVLAACGDNFAARLSLFRSAAARPRGTSCELLRKFLRDRDERLARMAVREIVRRRPIDFENMLLPLMTDAPESVRRIVSRSIGQHGFESYWERFDHMDRSRRVTAGKALLKLLPDTRERLARRLSTGNVEQRVKALQVARELELIDSLKTQILPLCAHANPRVRSKAVMVLGAVGAAAVDVLIEKVAHDKDARVRANAIEVMEQRSNTKFVPLLTERARWGTNRERANAVKALHSMKVGIAAAQLLQMLRDERPEHRISALWALRKVGWWRMVSEVARLAREDGNLKVRQFAMGVLQSAAGNDKLLRDAG